MNRLNPKLEILLAVIALSSGCGSSDGRWAEIARDTVQEQTRQNERMAQLQREVATGAKNLVEADAQNRRELVALHARIQLECATVGKERDQLDRDRKALDSQRQRESVLAAAILETGMLLACLAPLVLCGYLLRCNRPEEHHALVVELLVNELTSPIPKLVLPPAAPPRLSQQEPV